MDKYKIIILCGESGCGKDTLKNNALEKLSDIFHRVITATTRPRREGEIDGQDYYFLTEKEFNNTEMIESCCFNNWHYGTPTTSLSKDKINLLVLNPEGIYNLLKETEKYDIKIIRLIASDKERMLRQLNRETEPNVDEIVRRYTADKKDFGIFDTKLKRNFYIWDTEYHNVNFMTTGLMLMGLRWDIDFNMQEDADSETPGADRLGNGI